MAWSAQSAQGNVSGISPGLAGRGREIRGVARLDGEQEDQSECEADEGLIRRFPSGSSDVHDTHKDSEQHYEDLGIMLPTFPRITEWESVGHSASSDFHTPYYSHAARSTFARWYRQPRDQ